MSPVDLCPHPGIGAPVPGGRTGAYPVAGSPRRRAAAPLDPNMATFGNWHIRTLHVIAGMKGDGSTDRCPSVRDEAAITARN